MKLKKLILVVVFMLMNFSFALSQVIVGTGDSLGTNSARKIIRDNLGNIHLVYVSNYEIFYSKSNDNGVTWSLPLNISNTATSSRYPAIAIDGSNNVYIVWTEYISFPTTVIYFTKYDGVSWSAPVGVSIGTLSSEKSSIAIDQTNKVHVVYQYPDSSTNFREIYYINFDGSSWSLPLNVSNSSGVDSWDPSIAIDSTNKIHIVWNEGWPINEIYYSSYDGVSWSVPLNISNTSNYSANPSIFIDLANNIHVTWAKSNSEIYYTKYDGVSWSSALNISNTATGNSYFPSISADVNNNLFVVWQDTTSGYYEIYYSIYTTYWSNASKYTQNGGTNPNLSALQSSTNDLDLVYTSGTNIIYNKITKPTPLIVHLLNITRPGATDISIGEQFKVTASGTPNQTNVKGVIANADNLGPTGIIGGIFPLTETPVGSGNYEFSTVLPTDKDNGNNTVTKMVAVVSTDNFANIIVLSSEILTISAPQIKTTNLSNLSRLGATDIQVGESFKITATGTPNQTNVQGMINNANRLGQVDAVIGTTFNLVETPAGSGYYDSSPIILSTDKDAGDNTVTKIVGVVTNDNFINVIVITPEQLTITGAPPTPQIATTHLMNLSRVGATDINIGESFKITAIGDANQLNVVALIADANRIGAPDAIIGTPFTLTEIPAGSGNYDSLPIILSTDRDNGGNLVSKIVGIVTNDNFANVLIMTQEMLNIIPPVGPPDLQVIKWVTGPRPGFNETYHIFYFNNSTGAAANVQVTDTLPPTVTYISSDPPGNFDSLTNTISWDKVNVPGLANVSGLSAGSLKIIVNVPATTPLGSFLLDTAQITTTSSDSDLTNNNYTLVSTVVGSWDPNNKIVSPVGYILNDETLNYIINFENKGTAPAVNIKITDTLDTNLDETSLQNIFGDNFTYNQNTRTVSYQLNNINLPPQASGFVSFKIKPNPNLPVGTTISDKAKITFDFNPPIETPTVTNTIGIPLPLAQITTPTDSQFINTNTINIYGSAFGLRYNQFNHYELEYGSGNNPSSWTQITSSQTEVLSNKLATWNITNLSGEYTLRLKAYNQTQNYAESKIKLFINVPPQITEIKDKIKEPQDVTFDKDNNLYVLDKDNKQPVKKINLTTNSITSLVNQKVEDAKKIVVDNQGTIYLLTEKNVLIFDPSGTLAYTLPISAKGVDIAVDTENKLYLLTTKGESSQVTIYGDSPQPIAQWTVPEQLISITANYFIYLSSKKEEENFIKVYTQEGELVANFGAGFKDNENHIVSIDIDNNFNLYALDKESKNDAIRGYNTEQQLYFIYGGKGKGISEFKEPRALSISSDGKYLAIADTENKRVQVIKFIPATNNQQIVKTKEDSNLTLTKILILPNPITGTTKTSAKLLVDAQGNIIDAKIEVYNSNGNKILSTPVFSTQLGKGKYKLSSPEVETKLWTLPNGVYFCRVTLSDGINEVSKVGKIVILK